MWNYEIAPAGWPSEVGYWLGMRIWQCYYEQMPDKHQAVEDVPEASADPAYSEDSDMAYDHGDTLIDQMAYKRHIPLRHDSKPVDVLRTAYH